MVHLNFMACQDLNSFNVSKSELAIPYVRETGSASQCKLIYKQATACQ